MTTVYNNDTKEANNVTLVECGAKVIMIRKEKNDGYTSVQLEIDKTKNKTIKREFRMNEVDVKENDELKVDIFEIGERVDISGISKAKGFQGVVKRYNFKGAPATHGHKHDLKKPGSIGCGLYWQH